MDDDASLVLSHLQTQESDFRLLCQQHFLFHGPGFPQSRDQSLSHCSGRGKGQDVVNVNHHQP
eukprot:1745652-Prorocentrum_lima.AAC.1